MCGVDPGDGGSGRSAECPAPVVRFGENDSTKAVTHKPVVEPALDYRVTAFRKMVIAAAVAASWPTSMWPPVG